ncbi:carboxylesterase/lipase family protein [Streptomyces violaceusniger]|uniref:Carboxylic ester hydrolase n=1 Tax=Streptomyces violaceusniger (strain Tu 4113) TaxID=653045 RepID=G2P7Q0_STRV4|nr:carboxylesterase family protein [Streptomyces violaceusniger]AEM87362.1 Carboxylesterase type B [Streptomyces violaceusniger Tu 4113]
MSVAPVVRTTGGLVRGTLDAGVRTFTAIPYAAAVTGPGRFAAPAPAPRWDGVREATAPGETAPAPARAEFGGMDLSPVLGRGWAPRRPGSGPAPDAGYLTVTVTTPEIPAGGLPVLVFVHGGGLTSGTGQAPLYDGSSFARNGVIVVTLNYRIGIAGWLDIPGAPANRGLLGVIAALRWVGENIGAFGGASDKVTVAGQSAGAMIVAALLANREAERERLFSRAIIQSGGGSAAITAEQAALTTRAVAEALQVRATPEELGAVDDRRLTEALRTIGPVAVRPGDPRDTSLGNSPFRCVIDGRTLECQPVAAVREGRGATVDLLIGTNREEANLYTVPSGAIATMSETELLAVAERRLTNPRQQLAAYRAAEPESRPGDVAGDLITGTLANASALLTDAHARHRRARTFAYRFAWRSTAFDGALGACHCVELPFVFHQTGLPELYGENALLGTGRPPPGLADSTHTAWAAFLRDGDPGWTPYDTDTRTAAVIDEQWSEIDLSPHGATALVESAPRGDGLGPGGR